jgi:hypothetical protein
MTENPIPATIVESHVEQPLELTFTITYNHEVDPRAINVAVTTSGEV